MKGFNPQGPFVKLGTSIIHMHIHIQLIWIVAVDAVTCKLCVICWVACTFRFLTAHKDCTDTSHYVLCFCRPWWRLSTTFFSLWPSLLGMTWQPMTSYEQPPCYWTLWRRAPLYLQIICSRQMSFRRTQKTLVSQNYLFVFLQGGKVHNKTSRNAHYCSSKCGDMQYGHSLAYIIDHFRMGVTYYWLNSQFTEVNLNLGNIYKCNFYQLRNKWLCESDVNTEQHIGK